MPQRLSANCLASASARSVLSRRPSDINALRRGNRDIFHGICTSSRSSRQASVRNAGKTKEGQKYCLQILTD